MSLKGFLTSTGESIREGVEGAKVGARTLYIQNQPGHGEYWTYDPERGDGIRAFRLTRDGMKWAVVIGAVVLGASMLSRGK